MKDAYSSATEFVSPHLLQVSAISRSYSGVLSSKKISLCLFNIINTSIFTLEAGHGSQSGCSAAVGVSAVSRHHRNAGKLKTPHSDSSCSKFFFG